MQDENLQQLMQKGALGMTITPAMSFYEDLASTKKIKYFSFCYAPNLLEKPFNCALLGQIFPEMDMERI
jgi:hypothetical protein